MAFASNKNAYGICDISGFRYRLKDMRKTWDGLLVGPDQYDPKHPQLVTTEDPIGAMITGNKLTASVGNVTITT